MQAIGERKLLLAIQHRNVRHALKVASTLPSGPTTVPLEGANSKLSPEVSTNAVLIESPRLTRFAGLVIESFDPSD